MFETFLKLYRTSFPIFEQRTLDQQNRAFADDRYSITLFEDQQQFVGFVAAWTFDQCVYIEHFAVSESLRGKGYGSRIMATFVEHSKKVVILEIDPIVDEKSKARLRFYKNKVLCKMILHTITLLIVRILLRIRFMYCHRVVNYQSQSTMLLSKH